MISTWNLKHNSDLGEMMPGPHVDENGKRHPAVGTHFQMLHRARFGDSPTAWSEKTQERFVATLSESRIFRDAIREVLRGK